MTTATGNHGLTDCWLQERATKADRTGNFLPDVKIVGLESLNGRLYPLPMLTRAIPLYEGAQVNDNHPAGASTAPRGYSERMGFVSQIKPVEGSGLHGRFNYNPHHPLTEKLLWDFENNPRAAAFSHNVLARGRYQGEKLLVEEITRVISVDLVGDGGTNRSLTEALQEFDMTTAGKTVKRALAVLLRESAPAEYAAYESVATASGIELAREFDVTEGAKPLDQLLACLEAMQLEVGRDAAKPALERAERMRTLMQLGDDARKSAKPLIENYRNSGSSSQPASATSAASGAGSAGDSTALRAVLEKLEHVAGRLDNLDKRELAEALCIKHGVECTAAIRESLMQASGSDGMELLLLTKHAGPQRLQESRRYTGGGGEYKAPASAKELASRCQM